MYDFNSSANLIIQGCIVSIIIGLFYSLWMGAKAYSGIISTVARLIGIGMLFVTISIIERLLITFGIVSATSNLALWQDVLTLIGLIFLGLGFSKLAATAKS